MTIVTCSSKKQIVRARPASGQVRLLSEDFGCVAVLGKSRTISPPASDQNSASNYFFFRLRLAGSRDGSSPWSLSAGRFAGRLAWGSEVWRDGPSPRSMSTGRVAGASTLPARRPLRCTESSTGREVDPSVGVGLNGANRLSM